MIKTLLIGLVSFSFFVFFSLALAQESVPASPAPTPVDYALPYPGLLPDHPLFFVKSLRDKILISLITNPVKKAEFHQLMADKYINMGVFLAEKNKDNLAIETLGKGVGYLKETQKYILELPPTTGDQIGNIKNKFERSLEKHGEVVLGILPSFNSTDQAQVAELISQIKKLQQEFTDQK